MFIYEKIETPLGIEIIIRSDGAQIPTNPTNSDYQRYLRWLENPDAEENGTIS
jgi:hypothetical protein